MLKVYHSAVHTKDCASFTAIYRDRYTTRSPVSVEVTICKGKAGSLSSGDLASRASDFKSNRAKARRNMAAVDEKVKQIIVEQLGVDEGEVTSSASFVDFLIADSLI